MKKGITYLLSTSPSAPSLASLVMRIVFGGGMALLHGYSKYIRWDEFKSDFATPFGMSDVTALWLTIFAELFCCLFIAAGLFTRIFSIPIIICMAVAAFNIHAGDSLADREGALTYLAAFLVIFFMGSGKYSMDHLLRRFRRNS